MMKEFWGYVTCSNKPDFTARQGELSQQFMVEHSGSREHGHLNIISANECIDRAHKTINKEIDAYHTKSLAAKLIAMTVVYVGVCSAVLVVLSVL